jgi:outer membrane protein
MQTLMLRAELYLSFSESAATQQPTERGRFRAAGVWNAEVGAWASNKPDRRRLARHGEHGRARARFGSASLPSGGCGKTAAYQTNPKLDAERAKLRATDEEVGIAESGFRPTVDGTADIGHARSASKPISTSTGSSEPWGYSISVRQSVFSGYRTVSQLGEANASVKAERENLRQVETTVLLEGATAYMDVVRDAEILRIRDDNVAVLTKDLESAETRRTVKEVTKTDVAQALARRAKAVSAADLARAKLKTSRADFERVVGHAPTGLGMPSLRLKQLPKTIDEAWALAEQQNPNVSSAMFREEAARYNVDKVNGELLPEVSLEASFAHRENPNAVFDQQEAASVSGRVNIPLYDGGEIRARVRQAKHTQVSRIQEIEQARTETQSNVTSAWSRLMAARAQLKSDKVQVEANRIALEGVREEEKVGQRTLLDVLNAEQEYLGAQIDLVTTRRDLVVASYQVLAQVGVLSAEQLELGSEIYDPQAHYEETLSNWFGVDIVRADGRREAYRASDPAEEGDIVE